ncbi:UL16-binding protein 1-like isoform X2 [Loxodonta africana]|nr:UL16-binding protein 1-like isoform X2 [Loxodonta africana]
MALALGTQFAPGLLLLLRLPGWIWTAPTGHSVVQSGEGGVLSGRCCHGSSRLARPEATVSRGAVSRLLDAHFLCYNFSSGQRSYKIQGQVDGRTFLHYNSKNVTVVGHLGLKISRTEEWKDQMETLTDVADNLKQFLPNINREKIRAPLTLQAQMCCYREGDGNTTAFWKFGFDGYVFLVFDPVNKNWTEGHPGSRIMREIWEKIRDLNKFFENTSKGDCQRWLEKFLGHWEDMLEPKAQVTMASATTQPNVAITPSPGILLVTVGCSILLANEG